MFFLGKLLIKNDVILLTINFLCFDCFVECFSSHSVGELMALHFSAFVWRCIWKHAMFLSMSLLQSCLVYDSTFSAETKGKTYLASQLYHPEGSDSSFGVVINLTTQNKAKFWGKETERTH